MRIAYVINSVEGGGAAAPVPAVIGVLRDAGCEVAVFALTPRDRRGLPAMVAADIPVTVREGGPGDHAAAGRWLDARMAEYRPDRLWTSLTRATLLGQLVGLRRRVPVVSWQHAAWLKPANLRLLRATQRLSALWIGDSSIVTELTAARLRIPPARLATWPLFAAADDLPQAPAWRPGTRVAVGSLGRLHPVKGYDVLVDALAHMRAQGFAPPAPFSVTLAGDGAERGALAAQAAAAGIDTLHFAGFTDRPHDFLARLHLYVQPSRSEGLCIAAHEAMAAGLPAIVSAVGQMPRSVVPGETGQVVPPGDPVALAGALVAMLRAPERLHEMGLAARARTLDLFGAAAFAVRGHEIVSRIRALS